MSILILVKIVVVEKNNGFMCVYNWKLVKIKTILWLNLITEGGIVKKAFYSSLLASGAATICYPKEASELFNKGWGTIKEKSTGIVTFLK